MKRGSKEVKNPIPVSVNGFKATVGDLNRQRIRIMALGGIARINTGLNVTQLSAIKAIESMILNLPIIKYAEVMNNSGVITRQFLKGKQKTPYIIRLFPVDLDAPYMNCRRYVA